MLGCHLDYQDGLCDALESNQHAKHGWGKSPEIEKYKVKGDFS